jgi:hypothetical protein
MYTKWNMPKFILSIETSPEEMGDHEDIESLFRDTEHLRSLCRKEVERFEQYCNATDPSFEDGVGFVRIEARVLEGYLYQKLKGHIDAHHEGNLLPKERQDGAT